MRIFLSCVVVALAACPRPAAYSPRGDMTTSSAPTTSSGGVSAPEAAAESGENFAPTAGPPRTRQHTAASPCIYDARADRYAICDQMTGDGQCAAFGAPCGAGEMGATADVEPCMYDARQQRYQHCSHVTNDGRCAAYGLACGDDDLRRNDGTPPCLYDPATKRFAQCSHMGASGTCAAFGRSCTP